MQETHPDAKPDAFLKGATTFLCGVLLRKGYRVTALPGREGTAVPYGDNMLISDRSGTAVVLAFRRAAQAEEFGLALVDDLVAVQRAVSLPVVLIGVSRISSALLDRLTDHSIQVLQYPQTGMKELSRRIGQILATEGRSIEPDPGQRL